MRALLFCLVGLMTASSDLASAQMKLSTKPANANETRYFTAIDGLMDGNADVILKETRQGKTVTSAVLDVCYPAEKGSDRKDRFVADLAVNGQTMTGTTQTLGGKLPVTVKLARKPTGDTFEFKGQISIGQSVTEVASSDNSDLSEKEFRDNQTVDDGIAPAPKDFSEVSPESIGVKVKLDAALDFLKSLKGQELEVTLSSLTVTCDALRAGEQTFNLSADPDRAAALITKFRTQITGGCFTCHIVAELCKLLKIHYIKAFSLMLIAKHPFVCQFSFSCFSVFCCNKNYTISSGRAINSTC